MVPTKQAYMPSRIPCNASVMSTPITFELPNEPPELSARAPRALLALLVAAAEPGRVHADFTRRERRVSA